jgi:hypothetical protein
MEDDLTMESAVLSRAIEVHPDKLTIAELIRELAGENVDFATKDAIERAARDLAGCGLLHLHDSFVSPTRAALRSEELREG